MTAWQANGPADELLVRRGASRDLPDRATAQPVTVAASVVREAVVPGDRVVAQRHPARRRVCGALDRKPR
ncbi:hypothetical protein [Streptomyces sp. RG80]|uniref:hypothetical protein n=1 Tax=Streptomyces sp. RG80 TaxID=3157340 RepID=UPI00338F6988